MRHYGLKLGDKVKINFVKEEVCTIVEFAAFDNNGCRLQDEKGNIFPYTCEWCTKVEN